MNVAGGTRGAAARKWRPPVQLEMKGIADAPLKRRGPGGTRAGAGRKLAPGKRRSVPHRKRPEHDGRHPVLVTLRALRGLPALRHQLVSEMLQRVLRAQRKRHAASGFHIAEFSIQDNHLHFVVEATGLAFNKGADAPDALRAGVSGLVIAFAKQLNKLLRRRKGKVWGDRWHGRELASPSEVRSALVYVLRNAARHGAYFLGEGAVDPYSSAPRFTGWKRPVKTFSIETEPWPPASPPLTWMLETGWRLIGLLDPNEARLLRALYVHMGFHPAWKYRKVVELIFEDGKIVRENDRSEAMAELRERLTKEPLEPGAASKRSSASG